MSVKRYLVILCLCVACEELVLVTGYFTGTLSPRAFGLTAAAVLFITWIIATFFLKKARKKDTLAGSDKVRMNAKQRVWRIWYYRIAIVLMNLFLVMGLWLNKDGPFLPLVVGVTVNLAITAGLILRLRTLQRESA